MGAWGVHPIESDSGQEFLDEALSKVPKYVRRGLTSDDHQEVRGAAFLLECVGYFGMYPGDLEEDLDTAIQKLNELLKDKELASSWKDPKAWKASVRKQVKALKARKKKPNYPSTETLMQAIGIGPDGKILKRKLLR